MNEKMLSTHLKPKVTRDSKTLYTVNIYTLKNISCCCAISGIVHVWIQKLLDINLLAKAHILLFFCLDILPSVYTYHINNLLILQMLHLGNFSIHRFFILETAEYMNIAKNAHKIISFKMTECKMLQCCMFLLCVIPSSLLLHDICFHFLLLPKTSIKILIMGLLC